MADDWRDVPLDELGQKAGGPTVKSYYSVGFEFQRRQTQAQIEAAEYAKKSVRRMFWSVVVLAAASVASFVLNLLTFLRGAGVG